MMQSRKKPVMKSIILILVLTVPILLLLKGIAVGKRRWSA